MDYKNGKIYRLICEETGKQYIGSTCTTLVRRLYNHKHKANRCASKNLINPTIILIEDYPCDRKEQLTARERYFIETMDCVNKQIPGRTNAEYYQDNKEKIQKYKQDHKEEISEYQQIYREENREKINENKRKYYHGNREEINEKKNEKITCECGCIVARVNMSRHKKTTKHINLLN